jgi:hypothetical protein
MMGWKFTVFCVGSLALAIYAAPKLPEMTTTKVVRDKDAWRYDKSFSQEVVEAAVRPMLRDPQSAVFSNLTATNDRKTGKSPAGLVICGQVNAKNGFGGYTGNKNFINFYGTMMTEIEPATQNHKFNLSWNNLCAG